MRLVSTVGRLLTACGVAGALVAGAAPGVTASAHRPAAASGADHAGHRSDGPREAADHPRKPADRARHQGAYARLHLVTALSAERLATADLVAAAKYGTGAPIDDPARERQVLDTVARLAREAGGDPEATVRIFRDQIEANKVVQRALHRAWDADPSSAPTERPDLGKVREVINRVNGDLVLAVAASAAERGAPYCPGLRAVTVVHVRHERALDALHASALGHAVRSVCD
ncbi:gamma subclass chorismate mutase AroQ [Streptomyces sp. G45]|uniref:gamma subclass chorismate mutase AroQ n=1 Tax=Streptomyces sp. G45 TaxID=3406627 RepID=UPI003C140120